MIGYDELVRRAAAGEFQGLYVASDAIDPWIDEAASQALRSKVGFLVVQDTNVTPLAHLADVVLAGATFAEKAGCYVNADGRLQYSEAALAAARRLAAGPRPVRDPARTGPAARSARATVLAELAEADPGIRRRRGGRRCPRFGVVLGEPAAGRRPAPAPPASPTPGSSPTAPRERDDLTPASSGRSNAPMLGPRDSSRDLTQSRQGLSRCSGA